MIRNRPSLAATLAALVADSAPASTFTRPSGSVIRTWNGFVAGVSRGNGEKTHNATITHDTAHPLNDGYSVSPSCRRSAFASTSAPERGLPTCERCAKALAK